MRLANALIMLGVCAGWSEPLLVALTTLLKISCRGSNHTVIECEISKDAIMLHLYSDAVALALVF